MIWGRRREEGWGNCDVIGGGGAMILCDIICERPLTALMEYLHALMEYLSLMEYLHSLMEYLHSLFSAVTAGTVARFNQTLFCLLSWSQTHIITSSYMKTINDLQVHVQDRISVLATKLLN